MHASTDGFRLGRTQAWIDGDVRAVDLTLRAERIELAPTTGASSARGLAGTVAFPGMVNAHDHLHLNAFPDALEGAPYRHADDWVDEMRARIETAPWRRVRSIPVERRAWQGGIKNLLAGATTVAHHDPRLAVFDHADFPVHVVRDIGWAHSIGLGAQGGYGPDLETALADADPERPFMLHLGEGRGKRALRELERLERLGGMRRGTILVHGIGIDVRGAERAVDAGAALVFCPSSNRRLIGAVADPGGFLDAGRIALGSDSRLTGSRDLLDELAEAHERVGGDPARMLPLVFAQAAEIVGRPEAGRIEDAAPADLIWIRSSGASPASDLISTRRADLCLVVRAGRPMIADPAMAWIFEALGEPWLDVELDGMPKIASGLAFRPHFESEIEEPGLRPLGSRSASLRSDSVSAPSPEVPSGVARIGT